DTAKPPVETPVRKPPDAGVTLRAETTRPQPKPPAQEAQVPRPPKPEPEKVKTTPNPPPRPEPAKVEANVVPREPPKPEVKPGTLKPERTAHAPTALA